MTHSCLPIETCLFLASCYSSFSLFKQSLMPLNYDFWWNLRGVLHGEGAGMGTHPSPFMVNTKQGKKNRFCATTLFSLSFPPPPPRSSLGPADSLASFPVTVLFEGFIFLDLLILVIMFASWGLGSFFWHAWWCVLLYWSTWKLLIPKPITMRSLP